MQRQVSHPQQLHQLLRAQSFHSTTARNCWLHYGDEDAEVAGDVDSVVGVAGRSGLSGLR